MFSSLRSSARRFQQTLDRLLALALVGTALAALVFTLLFLLRGTFESGTALWLVSMAYLGVRLVQARAAYRRVDRGTLEAQLLLQPLDAPTLAACLHRRDHLWARSHILQGLRRGLQIPELGRLRASEQQRRIYQLYADLLRPLRPSLLRPNLLLLVALFALWATRAEPASVQLWYAIGCTALLGLIELAEVTLVWRAQECTDALAAGLSQWTLEQTDAAWLGATPRPYAHQRLYFDVPWKPTALSP